MAQTIRAHKGKQVLGVSHSLDYWYLTGLPKEAKARCLQGLDYQCLIIAFGVSAPSLSGTLLYNSPSSFTINNLPSRNDEIPQASPLLTYTYTSAGSPHLSTSTLLDSFAILVQDFIDEF